MTDDNPYYSGAEDYSYFASDNLETPVLEKPVKKSLVVNRRIIELFIAGIFIVLLILITVLFLGMVEKEDKSSVSSTTIINYYTINSYNEEINYVQPSETVMTSHSISHSYSNKKEHTNIEHYSEHASLDYVSRGEKIISDRFLGDSLDSYYVYVKNKGVEAEYFTVRFNFYDKAGNENTELLTKYILSGQEEVFVYRDVYLGGHDFVKWNYNILRE